MIRRTTWKLKDRPGSYGKQRPQIHPPAKSFKEIDEKNQLLFLMAADIFLRRNNMGETVYAYGSRTIGNFVDRSDVDIAIKIPKSDYEKINFEKFYIEYKGEQYLVDVKAIEPDPTINYITIST